MRMRIFGEWRNTTYNDEDEPDSGHRRSWLDEKSGGDKHWSYGGSNGSNRGGAKGYGRGDGRKGASRDRSGGCNGNCVGHRSGVVMPVGGEVVVIKRVVGPGIYQAERKYQK